MAFSRSTSAHTIPRISDVRAAVKIRNSNASPVTLGGTAYRELASPFFTGSEEDSMALKPCGECGEAISSRAKTCPHCGIGKPFQSTLQRNLDSARQGILRPSAGRAFLCHCAHFP